MKNSTTFNMYSTFHILFFICVSILSLITDMPMWQLLLWASSVISGIELTVVLFSNRNNGEQRTMSSADESTAMGPLPNVDLHFSNNGEQRYLTSSPHNPTREVFTKDEFETIAGACHARDCLAITDEVYEHITYDNETHISLASLSGMQRGWIIGWVVAPACIASAIRNIHTKLTDSAPAPFQEAALTALRSPLEYFESLRKIMNQEEITLSSCLLGLASRFNLSLKMEFVEELIKQAEVVAVLGYQERYIRMAIKI
ncbi:unnamed protein product [Camellia sinensis]